METTGVNKPTSVGISLPCLKIFAIGVMCVHEKAENGMGLPEQNRKMKSKHCGQK